MNPAVAFLIAESIKILLNRLHDSGKFNTLTEAEARQMADDIGASLATSLPSPGDLEAGSTP